MRKSFVPLACLALLVTVLAPWSIAPTASALILCEDCSAFDPPSARCFGTCQGQSYRYCGDWIADGCPTLQFAPATSEGLFEASCEAPALPAGAAPAETLQPAPVLDDVEPLVLD